MGSCIQQYSKTFYGTLSWDGFAKHTRSPQNGLSLLGTSALIAEKIETFLGCDFSSFVHFGKLGRACISYIDIFCLMDAVRSAKKAVESFGARSWAYIVDKVVFNAVKVLSATSQLFLCFCDHKILDSTPLSFLSGVANLTGVIDNGHTILKGMFKCYCGPNADTREKVRIDSNQYGRLHRLKNIWKVVDGLALGIIKALGLLLICSKLNWLPHLQWISGSIAGISLVCYAVSAVSMLAIDFIKGSMKKPVEGNNLTDRFIDVLGDKNFFRFSRCMGIWLSTLFKVENLQLFCLQFHLPSFIKNFKEIDGGIYGATIPAALNQCQWRQGWERMIATVTKTVSHIFSAMLWIISIGAMPFLSAYSGFIRVSKCFLSCVAISSGLHLDFNKLRWFEISGRVSSFGLNFFGLGDQMLWSQHFCMPAVVYNILGTIASGTGTYNKLCASR